MAKPFIRASWNPNTDVTAIKYNLEFSLITPVARLDFLQDVIAELTEEYNSRLKTLRTDTMQYHNPEDADNG